MDSLCLGKTDFWVVSFRIWIFVCLKALIPAGYAGL